MTHYRVAHLGVSVVDLVYGKNIPMRPSETPQQREAAQRASLQGTA
jgi:hypothetical protein